MQQSKNCQLFIQNRKLTCEYVSSTKICSYFFPIEQRPVEMDLEGHSSVDVEGIDASSEQQGTGKVDNEEGDSTVEESKGDNMEEGDATDQPEEGGREKLEEPISEEIKRGRVEVDSSKNEHEEGDGMIEKSEGDAMEDDAATQSESDATYQPEGEREREEDPIIVSSEENTPQRK